MQNNLHELKLCIEAEKNTDYLKSSKLSERCFQNICTYLENDFEKETYLEFLKKLIESSIIISRYPKRIIRKGTSKQNGIQIDTSIKCLLKPSNIIFENVLIIPFMCTPDSSGKNFVKSKMICNKIESKSQDNLWWLKKMQYKSEDSSRLSRNSTCEKRVIVFEFQALWQTSYLSKSIHKELFSDTIVTICHSHQEVDSQITLFLDDYYRKNRHYDTNLLNFECFDSLNLESLIENLSDLFKKETKRPLTKNNKCFLLEKIQNMFHFSDSIRLDDFVKRCMPRSKFSFPKWIMSVIKMLKIPTLETMWQHDIIEGFISKNVENMFYDSDSFLLRFSERNPAIGVVKISNDTNVVEAWEPYSENQLRTNNLANLLNNFSCLKTLRKANGHLVSCSIALKPFLDPEIIDDGYTPRGTRCLNEGERIDSSSLDEMDIEQNIVINNEDDWDLNEIYNACKSLLSNSSNDSPLTDPSVDM